MADAQLDELQQSALKIEFDPLDIDAEQFITAPRLAHVPPGKG